MLDETAASASEVPNVNLDPDPRVFIDVDNDMLQYETEIFLDIVQKDGIVIAAKGVDLLNVIANILRVYVDAGNLVFVINSSEHEERSLLARLGNGRPQAQQSLLHTTTYSSGGTDERSDLYRNGGVHFVTTRILVLDLLKKRVPIDKITGVVVLNAHRVLESGQEAFVMRLYRQNNKGGFVKAFSNDAQSFTYGFGQLERIMRNLFVREVHIVPRFHSSVMASLKARPPPELIELHIPITGAMERIQTCLLELINTLIKEIKAANKTVELAEVTVENCLLPKFMRLLQTQLDGIWERLSGGSRRLIGELRTLHQLLVRQLFHSDAVAFQAHLQQFRTTEYTASATWPYYRDAEQLFAATRGRVLSTTLELNPEYCPKWKPLFDILNSEIPADIASNSEIRSVISATVLILCQDRKTCHQLHQFLRYGPRHYLFLQTLHNGIKFNKVSDAFKSCKSITPLAAAAATAVDLDNNSSVDSKQPKRAKRMEQSKDDNKSVEEAEEEEELQNVYCLTMHESFAAGNESVHEDGHYIFDPATADCRTEGLTIVIRTFREAVVGEAALPLPEALQQLAPSYVIMYQTNVTAIRQLEIYEARKKVANVRTKIFFMVHTGTVDEQSYLTSLRREKQAFEHLIETKTRMVVPEEQDGRSEGCIQSVQERESSSSRIGGASGDECKRSSSSSSIIVDMREFRSELPALLHRRGVHVEPLTIAVGDYILTRDICVERKSVADLVGSLQSGRLYAQCTAMHRCYARPMLLIEFDQNKSFSWDGSQYMISSDGSSFDVQRKLLLLTMHFPKLRIIWSANPYASAALFEELKEGKEEPQVDSCVHAQQLGVQDSASGTYNATLSDMLPRLPGVTSRIAARLLAAYVDLSHLCAATETQLGDIMSAADARALYAALHAEMAAIRESGANDKGGRGCAAVRNKFKYNNNKRSA